jgi:metal-dependent amidase/aminoacylase/carboxypeptidase family protein
MLSSRQLRSATLAAVLLAAAPATALTQQQALLDRIDRHLESVRDSLIAVRRDIHRHPELSGEEERTAGVVALHLERLGFEVRTGVGGHGVVGFLHGGKPGPVVAFRADMDAVRSTAPDPVEFASEYPGVRHICGHDIHTTVGLGIAEAFSAIREQLPGTVVLVFQPAEENVRGAAAMIEDGVLENPAPQAIFAYHSSPLQVGQVGSVEGLALPGLDRFTAVFTGGKDPEGAAGVFRSGIVDLNTPDDAPPEEFVRVMPGRTGTNSDGHWVVAGAVRAGSPAARMRVRAWMDGSMAGFQIAGTQGKLEYHEFAVVPDMVNDPELVRSTLETFRAVLGEENLLEINQVTPQFSEDFARYQQHIPGAMYWLGVANSELGYNGMPHSPGFAADEAAIGIGAGAMAAVLLHYLETR